MKMPKSDNKHLLFIPNTEGLAHIIRSAVIAEAMAKNGHKCIIAVPVTHEEIVSKITKYAQIETVEFKDDPALLFRQVAEEYGKSGTLSRSHYDMLTKPYIPIIKKYPGSIAVIDSHPFARVPVVINGMRNIWVGTPGAMTYMKKIPGFPKNVAGNIASKALISMLNKATYQFLHLLYGYMQKDGHPRTTTIDDVIIETAKLPKLIFETKNAEVFGDDIPNFYTSEPIFSNPEIGNAQDITRYKQFIGSKKSVYISFGGTGYSPTMIKKLIKKLLASDFAVICSRGTILKSGDLEQHPNLLIEDFIPGIAAALSVDAIISHGSQGTVEQALITNTPLIALPFNLDQIMAVGSANSPDVINIVPQNLLQIGKLSSSKKMSQFIEKTNPDKIFSAIDEFTGKKCVKPKLDYIKSLNDIRIHDTVNKLEQIITKYWG